MVSRGSQRYLKDHRYLAVFKIFARSVNHFGAILAAFRHLELVLQEVTEGSIVTVGSKAGDNTTRNRAEIGMMAEGFARMHV